MTAEVRGLTISRDGARQADAGTFAAVVA